MAVNPYKDDLSRFAVSFTRAVIAWNNAEDSARTILKSFSSGGMGVMIAAQHLGSIALRDALLTLCDLFSDPNTPNTSELTEHVAHFVDGMDRLRAYRNFYVHSLRSVGKKPDEPETFHGYLHAIEAKGRYAFVEGYVDTAQLEQFMRHCLELQNYGRDISLAMPEPTNALAGFVEPKLPSSLQKPTWPEKLKKHRSYLQER